MFLHLSVILFTGRGGLPTPRMQTPQLNADPLEADPRMQTSPLPDIHGIVRDTVNKRVVRILLECILVTVRKRSLRRLCFYTCLSVILFTGGGGVYPSMQLSLSWCEGSIQVTSNAWWDRSHDTPPGQVHPPRAGTPHWVGTPPPGSSVCWEIRATSGRYASYWNAFLFKFHVIWYVHSCSFPVSKCNGWSKISWRLAPDSGLERYQLMILANSNSSMIKYWRKIRFYSECVSVSQIRIFSSDHSFCRQGVKGTEFKSAENHFKSWFSSLFSTVQRINFCVCEKDINCNKLLSWCDIIVTFCTETRIANFVITCHETGNGGCTEKIKPRSWRIVGGTHQNRQKIWKGR